MRWAALVVATLTLGGCGTPHCPPGLSRCDDVCVDTQHAELHCGGCYNECLRPRLCEEGVCHLPACSNGVRDGAETAIDCGGPECAHCGADLSCTQDSDCASGHCRQPALKCSASGCDDGLKDGTETDVDCGHTCPTKCGLGAHCSANADCAHGVCFGDGVCRTEDLLLTTDRTFFYVGLDEVAHLTASYLVDGIGEGNVPVAFNADFGTGTFVDADGGSLGQMVTAATDSIGAAHVDFVPAPDAGSSLVVAKANGNYATVSLTRLGTKAPVWQSTRCGGVDCTELVPRGTGANDTAVVTFLLVDSTGTPIAGAPVAFDTPTAPAAGIVYELAGVTDANGLVSTTVQTGTAIGYVWISASAPNGLTGYAPNLAIVALRPTNDEAFTIYCTNDTFPAWESLSPPLLATTDCNARLVDRYGNPVSAGVVVNLVAEAGWVPPQVSPNGVGAITFPFSTDGGWPPVDVSPLPALANNGPMLPRDAEPVTDAGGNPRDGLVTVMAYARGDEYLHDLNGNGVRDPGEWFIDQGEPLLDADDDGVWTPGETFIDTNSNGVWDGPNGLWDTDVLIWSDVTFLYTGLPAFLTTTPAQFGVCPGGVPKSAVQTLTAHLFDSHLNLPQGDASAATVTHSATKGYVQDQVGLTPFDSSFGSVAFVFADGGTCDAGSDPCYRQRFFDKWPDGFAGTLTVHGADFNDLSACQNDIITTTVTVNGIQTQFFTPGAIQ